MYKPPEEGTDLISKIIDLIISKTKATLVKGGDLNLIMNPTLDCQHNIKHKAEKSSQFLKRTELEIDRCMEKIIFQQKNIIFP